MRLPHTIEPMATTRRFGRKSFDRTLLDALHSQNRITQILPSESGRNMAPTATHTDDECPFAFAVVYKRRPLSPVDVRQTITSSSLSPRRKNYVDSKRTIQEKQQQSKVRKIVLHDSFSQWLGNVEWSDFDETTTDASIRSNPCLGLPPRPPADTQSLHSRSMHLYPLKDAEATQKEAESIKSESWHGVRTCFTESASSFDKAPKLPTRRGRESRRRSARKSQMDPTKSRKQQRDTSQSSKGSDWTMDDILSIHRELFGKEEEINDYSTRSAPSTSRTGIQMSPKGRSSRCTRRGGSIRIKSDIMSHSLRCERTTVATKPTSRCLSPSGSSSTCGGGGRRCRSYNKNNRATATASSRRTGSISPIRRPVALEDQCRRLKIVF